ncbi:hypothetical protein X769_23375 [Mesorhizobium sp. LSJC268A00]|nr:hypothetical protein X769_23375 [Mesorhizobium sp. LSJC268A00]
MKLKLKVTLAFPTPAGGVQHAWMASPTSAIVSSGAASEG